MFFISKIQEIFFSLYSQKQDFENRKKKKKTVTKHNLTFPDTLSKRLSIFSLLH